MDRDYHYMYEYNYPAGSSPDGLISVIMSVYLIILTLVLILALGILSCLGYGPLAGIKPLGLNFLDFFDFITNSVLMPIVALITCIIVGYIVKPRFVIEEVESSGEFKTKRVYVYLVKFVCPVFMALILITGLLSYFGIYSI